VNALAAGLVSCVGHACASTTDTAVLMVMDAETTTEGMYVGLKLYSRRTVATETVRVLTNAVVKVERRGDSWTGVSYLVEPASTSVKTDR
jgi:hypothetical protein